MADRENGFEAEADERQLELLQARFSQALEARGRGDVDSAAELLRGLLKVEPRLAEPRLELAHILAETGQLHEAEDQVREALAALEGGGRWTEDLDDDQILSLAWGTLGEILRRQAESDDAVFGPPEGFQKLVDEAKHAFERAMQLDPDNAHAREWGSQLGALAEEGPEE